METKVCIKCKQEKELSEFYFRKDWNKYINTCNDCLKKYNSDYSKNEKSKSYKILGCDYKFLNNYLLQTFKDNYGYEWDEKEPVHIDHIIPLATAKTEKEIIKLCHYKNLQLLKAKDNLKKGSKLNWILEKGG